MFPTLRVRKPSRFLFYTLRCRTQSKGGSCCYRTPRVAAGARPGKQAARAGEAQTPTTEVGAGLGLAADMSTPLKKLSPWQAWQERWPQEGLWRSESQDGQWSEAYKLRGQFQYC